MVLLVQLIHRSGGCRGTGFERARTDLMGGGSGLTNRCDSGGVLTQDSRGETCAIALNESPVLVRRGSARDPVGAPFRRPCFQTLRVEPPLVASCVPVGRAARVTQLEQFRASPLVAKGMRNLALVTGRLSLLCVGVVAVA
jgi:hypothetical protein